MGRIREVRGSGGSLLLLLLGLTAPVAGQEPPPRDIRVVVIDSVTLNPIADASVRVAETTIVGSTDASGGLVLVGVPPGLQAYTVERLGYAPKTLLLDQPERETLLIVLGTAAIAIPGLVVEYAPFEERMDSIEDAMEFRMKRFLGPGRVIGYKEMQRYRDEVEDTEELLTKMDGVSINLMCEGCLYFGVNRRRPSVFIDEEEFAIRLVGWDRLTEMPPASICRIELLGRGSQLRVYTCTFLAAVLNGERTIPPVIWRE